jgi:2-hydroxychromene-2-carboxylate isomerase
MSGDIDFYFDFSSPYGYFASTRIEALADKYRRTLRWHPMLLGVAFKTTGAAPLPLVPLKGEYSYRDFERSARFHDIPYRRPPQFPLSTQLAARAMLWLQQSAGSAQAVGFMHAVYRAYFVDGADISQPDTIAGLAGALGIDGAALLEAASSAPVKDSLRTEVENAIARGVFGSPFVIFDDEPFWGFDRFGQLEAFLRDGKI